MSKYSKFRLDHEHKMTGNMGYLYPCMCLEVMPGDRFKSSSDLAMRLMPLVSPMMHRVDVFMHFFFVPTRLIWKDFDKFLTGGDKGTTEVEAPYMLNSTPAASPTFTVSVGSLGDYLGLPCTDTGGTSSSLRCSALPFRAYSLVYNEWYRDQQIIDPVGFTDANGGDRVTNRSLLKRAWKRGYFENALPNAQKGAAVDVPFASEIPVYAGDDPTMIRVAGSGDDAVNMGFMRGGSTGVSAQSATVRCPTAAASVTNETNLYASLDGQSGVSINDLRLAFQVQRYLEKVNRGGSRMIEFLLEMFNVRSSDARLQRPEYIGGGRCPIVVGDVLQTSSTDETTPQGNMAGQGYAAMHAPGFRYRAEEFGYIMGFLSVMPQPTYQQGLHKMWSRFSRYDYPFPVFSRLGDQPIFERELYYKSQVAKSTDNTDGYSNDNDTLFGYAPRYEEFRRIPSQVHGQFRTSLDFWHMGRIFSEAPTLSADFVNCSPTDRVFAVQDGSDKLVIQIVHNTSVIRQLPKFGVPGLIDHN